MLMTHSASGLFDAVGKFLRFLRTKQSLSSTQVSGQLTTGQGFGAIGFAFEPVQSLPIQTPVVGLSALFEGPVHSRRAAANSQWHRFHSGESNGEGKRKQTESTVWRSNRKVPRCDHRRQG